MEVGWLPRGEELLEWFRRTGEGVETREGGGRGCWKWMWGLSHKNAKT